LGKSHEFLGGHGTVRMASSQAQFTEKPLSLQGKDGKTLAEGKPPGSGLLVELSMLILTFPDGFDESA
jgi:hypothetical protein